MTTILQTYLRHNLLDLEGEDGRLLKLNAASSELANTLVRTPVTALPVFLAVLRSDQDVGDSFTQVATAIENKWTTYHGAFRDGKALTLYKAVALQALVEAIGIQPVLGTAISLLMRNFGPSLEIGKNKDAFDILVRAADAAFTAEVEESRPTSQSISVPKAAKANKFDRAVLQKRIEAAVGPHDRAGQAGQNPNGHWPNAGNPWSYEFADRMTAVLGEYLDSVWTKAFENDAKYIEAINQLVLVSSQKASVNERMSLLLWWRQALYSETAAKPYRELQVSDAVIHAVLDISTLIPIAYDRSLESFLSEAILSLMPSQEELAGRELLKVLPPAVAELKAVSQSGGASGLLLSAIVQNDADARVVDAAMPPHRWAVWILRELKAVHALMNPKPVPEKEGDDA